MSNPVSRRAVLAGVLSCPVFPGWLLLIAGAFTSGCGGAPAKASEPSREEAPTTVDSAATNEGGEELNDVDDATRAFDSAESSLLTMLAAKEEPGQAEVAAERAAPPTTPPPAAPLADDRCSRACRALGSMRRSADRLCELTGRDDPRCQNVEQRLDRARDTVSQECPTCAS